uniref:Zinc-ribbon domain-containing protein n=1 Tax=Magallana gigas TaxID=29159 RepID=A0A8W8J147_MAGGI
MFCMECGMQLADGKAKFCGNCGTKVPSASKETDPGVEVLPPSFVQGTLSQGAMESLAKLKEKYPSNIGHKPVSKKRTSESKELIVHVMDKKKKALKRAFPSDSGLTGCLKMKANYNQTTKNWMDSLKHHFRGNIDFIPHIMGRNGLEPISTDCSLEQIESMKIQKKSALKIYAMAKGKAYGTIKMDLYVWAKMLIKVMESDEEMPKIELQKPSSKCGGKSLSKISTMQSDDVVKSDEEMPKIRLQKPVVESDEEMPNMRLQKPSSKCGGKSLPKMSTMQSDDIVESDVELPKVPLPVVESDVELPKVSLPSSKCSGENMPLGRKIKSSTMQSDDMADEYEIRFPKEGKRITIVYEVHGGMALSRPFDTDDTMLSVFTFACQEINPEILPPSFYFECVSTESCMFANCQHSFKLEECHGINIRDIPDVLLLKEAEYSLDDTLTNYGDVHLRGSVGPVFH